MDTLSPLAQDGNIPEKRCTGPCGRMLPNTSEFFHKNGNDRKGKPSGLRPDCKECRGKKVKTYYEQPDVHEQRTAYAKNYRAQPEKYEHIRKHKKEYYSKPEIREHKNEYTRNYRLSPESKEKRRIESSLYYSRPEVKKHRLEHEREYLQHPKIRERKQDRDRANQHTRRARKKSIEGIYTPEQIQAQLKRQKHRCYYAACGHARFEKQNNRYTYHVEHTFPISRVVGTDIPANDISYLVLACPSCNMSKGDKFPWEWPEGGRLL